MKRKWLVVFPKVRIYQIIPASRLTGKGKGRLFRSEFASRF